MVALITPFNSDKTIDYEASSTLIEKLILEGTDGFVVCGTTGESSTLSWEEKLAYLNHVINQVQGRVCIWMGCGSNNTLETLANCLSASQFNIDGIMLVTPYYNRPSQAGLYEHFKYIATYIDLPIMLYNVPKRTGVNLEASTLIRLANEFPQIVACKHASNNLEDINKILAETERLILLSGEDSYFLESLKSGMSGIVSVIGHVALKEVKKVFDDFQFGVENIILDQYLKKISQLMFLESSPSAIKFTLSKLGYCQNNLRLPLVPISKESENLIIKNMKI